MKKSKIKLKKRNKIVDFLLPYLLGNKVNKFILERRTKNFSIFEEYFSKNKPKEKNR